MDVTNLDLPLLAKSCNNFHVVPVPLYKARAKKEKKKKDLEKTSHELVPQ